MTGGRIRRTWLVAIGIVAVLIAAGVITVVAVSGGLGSNDDSTLAVPAEPRLLVVGDSYAEGIGAEDPAADNWARLAADRLAETGWQTRIDAAGGTGWVNGAGGPNTYGERLARAAQNDDFVPNVLVLQGGANDYQSSPDVVGDAVASSIEQARRQWPGIEVVVFSSSVPFGLTDRAVPLSTAIADAAASAGVPDINPVAEQWMTADTAADYTAGDGTHLTTAGYAYVADRFVADFSALFGLDR
ncbi:SGNH/GDSL hydrolase family protein [Rhodococcus kroppenstedtii]|uniref:SGNH/GDSL hydrolase family protein n=1 Tax=Rhodococcoides kroppenstedtii TaxID=293050 RepID=UPI0029559E39|nr:SGNH/GDSL hydrolase family protein [Rhodococcus kroppenstedtii]MDV7196757.1 SGNH/GDSL hydrolase family protein [Rhodococcus kroppenstedtii]